MTDPQPQRAECKRLVKSWIHGQRDSPTHGPGIQRRPLAATPADIDRSNQRDANQDLDLEDEDAEGDDSYHQRPAIVGSNATDDAVWIPRTVGEIKQAYRSRARREQAERDERSLTIVRAQRERVRALRNPSKVSGSPVSQQLAKQARQCSPTVAAQPEAVDHLEDGTGENRGTTPKNDNSGGAQVLELRDVAAMDRDDREMTLRHIRRVLSAGRHLRLIHHVRQRDDQPAARLAMQQLCAESLLFCHRDQDVTPVSATGNLLVLDLRSRWAAAACSKEC